MRLILAVLFNLLFVSSVYSATGDLLYQNCLDSGTAACSGGTLQDPIRNPPAWVRSVESTGCYSGSCLKLEGFANTSNSGVYGAGNTSIGTTAINNHNEITVSMWIKYDEAASSISSGNTKVTRLYAGNSDNYTGSEIVPHDGWDLYIDRAFGTFTVPSWATVLTDTSNSDYSHDNGDGTYTNSNHGYVKIKFDGAGAPTRPGTTWVKWTKYYKFPSTDTSSDGVFKIWLDNVLVFDMYDMVEHPYRPTMLHNFTSMTFYPSSEAREPFEQWMDEIAVYEGYVPPVSDPGPVRSNGAPSSTLSAGTTSVNLTLDTDS